MSQGIRPPCAEGASTPARTTRSRTPYRRSRLSCAVAALAAAALLAAGCGDGSSSAEQPASASSTQSGGDAGQGQATAVSDSGSQKSGLIVAVGAPLSDPFWGAVKQGTDAAAKQLGVNFQYVALSDMSNIVASYGQAIEQAISRRPAALIVGGFFPSVEGLVKKAVAAGIPVFMFDAGADSWKQWGALGFVGEDSSGMGQVAGRVSVEAGVKNGICVNGTPGNPQQDQRCNGYIDAIKGAGGKAKMIQVPAADATNPSAVTQDIRGALAADRDIDGIYTSTAALEQPAQKAVASVGRDGKVTIGTNDVSTQALKDVKAGKAAFVIDHQPYLEGYYAVQQAAQYLLYEMKPANAISSGPFAITKENVDKVLKVNETHPGIRGAQ